jgi:hypothetical protein
MLKVETEKVHPHASELDTCIGPAREIANALAPGRKDCVALAGIDSDP